LKRAKDSLKLFEPPIKTLELLVNLNIHIL